MKGKDMKKIIVPTANRRKLAALGREIETLVPDPSKPLDRHFIPLLMRAVETGQRGNFAVAAGVEVDGELVEIGGNIVRNPYFRSDGHAECVTLSNYESRIQGGIRMYREKKHTVYTTLPPCPMCTFRITNAGVPDTFFLGHDPNAIIEKIIAGFPDIWAEFYKRQNVSILPAADCSEVLHDLGWRVFEATNYLDQLLANR